jgi:ABC-type branched-subunit amino acid transport system substrate-binding protein
MAVDQASTITRGFLFADLRGYTDFVEQRGAAAAADLLTRYRELAREAIGQFGGAEIKTEGDSFFVVFDSVSSAVRCGLAITTAARAAADEPIRVGIGIHAGETVEADGGYVGSPVNIAARICAQAGPGEVLVSETVRALTTTVLPVRFKSRGRRQLKGVTDPIELFAVEELTDGAAGWLAPRRRRLSGRARVGLAGGAVVVLAAAAGAGWVALRPSTGLPAGPWTIGVHVPTSGDLASYGISIRNAVQLAVDQANDAGGVEGAELALNVHNTGAPDSDYEGFPDVAARGAAAATKMAADPRTIAAVGPFTSRVARSTIPITNRAGLLECSPSNSDLDLTKPEFGAVELRKAHPDRISYVRLSPATDVQARALAAFVKQDLQAASALVIVDSDWQVEATEFVEAFTALGGQVAEARLGNPDPERFYDDDGWRRSRTSGVLKRLNAASADVVVFAGDTSDGAVEVRQAMREAGLQSTPFVSWDRIKDGEGPDEEESYLMRSGKAADGTYVALATFAPPKADFVSAYRAAFGEEPSEYASAAYACMQVILASLEAAAGDGPGADELREAVRAHAVDPRNRYETVLGTLGFDANGDSTQQMVSFYRVDPQALDGAGDWAFVKQQDYGSPP